MTEPVDMSKVDACLRDFYREIAKPIQQLNWMDCPYLSIIKPPPWTRVRNRSMYSGCITGRLLATRPRRFRGR